MNTLERGRHSTLLKPSSILWIAVLLAGLLLSGCAGTFANTPINAPLTTEPAMLPAPSEIVAGTVIGLSFSGGGKRAAAFSYGVLEGLATVSVTDREDQSALDHVGFVSAVSGGSVTAAYFGLKGPDGYQDFDERFLYADVESALRTSVVDPRNAARLLGGGMNDRTTFGRWLDRNLFQGAVMGDLYKLQRPEIWINASDLFHRTPFPFIPELFSTFCSDVSKLTLSEAVSASAAVPAAFAPVVIERFPETCSGLPDWAERALSDPSASKMVRAAAGAAEDYASADNGRYIKLADGGLTDNFGLTSIVIGRYASGTPYGPMSAENAVRLRKMIYLVVSSEQTETGRWTESPQGPGLIAMLRSATDTAIASTVRLGYDNFVTSMDLWQDDLIDFRCSLSAEERARLGVPLIGWRCDDVEISVEEVSFESLPEAERARLNTIPTALTLDRSEIDLLIDAGRRAVLLAKTVQAVDGRFKSSGQAGDGGAPGGFVGGNERVPK